MSEHSGKAAIVTGANSGIGAAIAVRLAREGASVFLTARNTESLAKAADEIRREGGQVAYAAANLSDPQSGETLTHAVVEAFGRLDIVVNCASATKNAPFLTLTDEEWVKGFEVKVFGAMRLCRAAWPELVKNKGAIVNICGIAPRTPRNISAMSSLLSAPLYALTKVLADLGLKDGVRVNAINPGPVHTPRLQQQMETAARERGAERKVVEEEMIAFMGMTRWGTPEDTANLVAYILSSRGELLNGALIDLDGGATKGL